MSRMEIVREWLNYAANDLRTAKFIFENMYPKPLEIVCYHCQQATEKALKGFLVSIDAEPPRTHDLENLCKQCAEHTRSFLPMLDRCRKLTDFAAMARYPSNMEIEEHDAVLALRDSEMIYSICADLCLSAK